METNWMSFVAVLWLGYHLLFIKSEFRNAFQVDYERFKGSFKVLTSFSFWISRKGLVSILNKSSN